MNKMIFVLLFTLLPAVSFGQDYEDAIEFFYCGDDGWEGCDWSAEFNDCIVTMKSPSVNYDLNLNNVIWESAEIRRTFTDLFYVSCRGICVVDTKGEMKYWFSVMGAEFDPSEFSHGFDVSPTRVIKAMNVIAETCPGAESMF